jgi:CBS domain-containing protein
MHHGSIFDLTHPPNAPPSDSDREDQPNLARRHSKPMILSLGHNSLFKKLLSKRTVQDLKSTRAVVEIDSNVTPAEGFEILLKENILYAPVYDSVEKKYIGFLDVRDLVSSIIFAHEEQNLVAPFTETWIDVMSRGFAKFGALGSVTITYLSRRNPFRPVQANSTLLQVAKALSSQVHRVPVVDANGKCTAIISQSTIVQFLQANHAQLGADLSQTIGQLNLGLTKVIGVNVDTPAWNGKQNRNTHRYTNKQSI